MTNLELAVIGVLIASHWLAVWFGIDLERTKQRYIKQTQYKLDNERKKRGNQWKQHKNNN